MDIIGQCKKCHQALPNCYCTIDKRAEDFMETLNKFQDKWVITATVKNRRRYFYVEAYFSDEAIKIFNKNYPDIHFRNCKKLEQLT